MVVFAVQKVDFFRLSFNRTTTYFPLWTDVVYLALILIDFVAVLVVEPNPSGQL